MDCVDGHFKLRYIFAPVAIAVIMMFISSKKTLRWGIEGFVGLTLLGIICMLLMVICR